MGAYEIEVMLHDTQAEDFVRSALDDDWASLGEAEMNIIQSTAKYIAQRLLDASPALADSVRTPGAHMTFERRTERGPDEEDDVETIDFEIDPDGFVNAVILGQGWVPAETARAILIEAGYAATIRHAGD